MTDLLFVYGSLLSEVPSAMSRFLQSHGELRGEAFLPGQLFDLGRYPGFVYNASHRELVRGEVYRLFDIERSLPVLDKYEGLEFDPPEYQRHLLSTTASQPCWTYVYALPTDELPLIPGGDYRTYFQQHQQHQTFIQNGR